MTAEYRAGRAAGFYDQVFDGTGEIMRRAAEIEGIDEEITLLRSALKELWDTRADQMALLFRGIKLLVDAVAARHRMTPAHAEELEQALVRAARSIHDQILPPAIAETDEV